MNPFDVVSELRIGSVVEVSGSSVRVDLDGEITELTRTFGGHVYPIGQLGSIVKIHFGRQVLLGYVRLLRMRSELDYSESNPPGGHPEDSRILEADLFGQGEWRPGTGKFSFSRGVRTYPLPGQSAYLTTQIEVRSVFEGAEHERPDGADPMLHIGSYSASTSARCLANLDRLFGQHCAVLGSTGAGKSGTVAALIHALLEHQPKPESDETLRPTVIIIDPHGEYSSCFGSRAIVYRAYEAAAGMGANAETLVLPYWTLSGEEFRDLVIAKTEYEATSENNIVLKALEHARLVQRGWIENSEEWTGQAVGDVQDPAAPRPKGGTPKEKEESSARVAAYNRDTPDPFSLDEFQHHILNEQGVRVDKGKWAARSFSDRKAHVAVLDKLSVLRSDPRLAFMMADVENDKIDLDAVLSQFVGADEKAEERQDIRVIDISGLPNEVAGPLTAAIARLLFQYKLWQTPEERETDPVVLVCEEAHRYVPNAGRAEYESAQVAIRRLAKEGRKYGIGLLLVSQRPSDVESTVLSQCNSWLVLRLTNATDQEHVARFLPDGMGGMVRMLSALSRQEALFVGEAAAVPARIVLRTLPKEKLPESHGVSFVKGWSTGHTTLEAIKKVISRWRQEVDDEEAANG